ncbi:MAG TPA: hypothetical protein VIP28_09185 [Nocardioides sp.]
MSVRKETIILEMEDNASRPALGAVGPLQALNAELEALDGRATVASRRFTSMTERADRLAGALEKTNTSLGRASANLDVMGNRGMLRFTNEVDRGTASIDRFSGRVALLGTSILALGPSILPLTAAAVPAIGALMTGMVGASAAAATLVLAFQGVGSSVEAISAYRLEPTAENLAKVRQELEQLGPEGTQFVMALDELRPALEDLQRLSGAGIFPGFTEGLDQMVTRLPQVRDFVEDISTRVGNLGADTGDSLANDADWREFFAFVGDEAGPAMEEWGRATGNFVAGAANMVEALGELSGGVTGDVLQSSRDFREWADNLEHTEGFQEFAAYVRESGPDVADFLSSSGEALVALATAAAPWGSVVLPVLTTTADVFTAIAGSPIGPPLFTAAAALLAVSKASALLGPNLTKASTSVRGLGADLRLLSTGLTTFSWERSATQAAAFGAAADRTKARLASLRSEAVAAGPAIAAFIALSTGAADKAGLSNTAMLTMAGSMAGPWGTALGAGVGLTMDLAAANDDLQAAIKGATAAMGTGDLQRMNAELKTLRDTLKDTTESKDLGFEFGSLLGPLGGLANLAAPGVSLKKVMADLSGDTDKAKESIKDLAAAKAGLEDLAVALGANKDSAAEMASGADRAQVAMKALGISSEDLAVAQRAGGVEFDILSGRIQEYVANSETATGRATGVADAIADLGNDAISTADSATQLNAALQALFAPTLNLEAATDQWRASLKQLRDELNAGAGFSSFTEAGRKNNELTRNYVNDSLERLTALAEVSTTTEGDMARAVGRTREEFIKSGMAAGFSRKEITARANALGLTPELVKTVFEEAGIDEIEVKARGLKRRFDSLPKDVRTDIKANGIPKSEADIARLQRKYRLTPKDLQTLARLKDNASGPIAAVLRNLLNLDGRSATTTVTNRTINEIITISRGQSSRPDRRVMPGQTSNADGGFYSGGVRAFADGGWGMDGRYYSREPMLIPGGANILWGEKETGWEAYISGKPGQRERNLEVLAMAADRLGALVTPFASGGMPGGRRAGGRRDAVAAALWQSGHRDPAASLIAGMTLRQLERLGRSFDDLSSKRLGRFGRSMERASALQEKQTAAAQKRFDAVRDRRSQLTDSITGGLRSDLWADDGGSSFGKTHAAGSIGAVNAQLRADRDRAVQFKKDIGTLRKKGLNGAALQEIISTGDYDRARMFAGASRSAVGSFEAAFNARQAATASAGRTGGQVLTPEFNALKAQLERQVREQQVTNKKLDALRKEQDHRHDAAQKSRKENGAGSAARKGARDR